MPPPTASSLFGRRSHGVLRHLLSYAWVGTFVGCFLFPTGSKLMHVFQWLVGIPSLLLWFSGGHHLVWRSAAPALLLAAYLAASHFWSGAGAENPGHFIKLVLFVWMLMFATRTVLTHQPQRLQQALWLFVLLGTGHALCSMAWFYGGGMPWSMRLEGLGMLRNPIRAASLYGVALLVALWLAQQGPQRKARWVLGCAASVLVIAMSLTQSRGPLLVLMLAVLAYCGSSPRLHWNARRLALGLGGALALLGVLATPLLERIDDLNTVSTRLEIWSIAWEQAMDHPWFGSGLTRLSLIEADGELFKHAHNMLLDTFRWAGIAGLTLLIGTWAYYLWRAVRARREPAMRLALYWFGYGLATQSLNGMVPLTQINYQWFLFWLPLALICALDTGDSA